MSSFSHGAVYNPHGAASNSPARHCPACLVSPPHYIQGPHTVDSVGRYVKQLLNAVRVGVLITPGNMERIGAKLVASLASANIQAEWCTFGGVCSGEEIERVSRIWRKENKEKEEEEEEEEAEEAAKLQAVIAVGGGTCNDAGKSVAHALSVPVVVVSTLAATDAPCSALSILYSQQGEYKGGQVFPQSPNIVVVDTAIIAASPVRTLVSGFGDAMSTYYEARTCFENGQALTMLEARPTMTAFALAKLCADMLYEHALPALASMCSCSSSSSSFSSASASSAVSSSSSCSSSSTLPSLSLERVVEANTLLSGVGFESGGLAASHAVAQALSWVKTVHDQHMHGEMVAIGLMTMLMMEKVEAEKQSSRGGDDCDRANQTVKQRDEELAKVGEFCCRVGLPVTLTQIHFNVSNTADMDLFTSVVLKQWFCHNEPFAVTTEVIRIALLNADEFGRTLVAKYGQEAYLALHKE